MEWVNTNYIRVSEGQFFVYYAFFSVLRIEGLIAFWPIIRLFCAILSVVLYFTEPLILCCYIIHLFKRSLESSNLKSALTQPQVVSAKLEKESAAGRIAGPFHSPPFPYFRCAPLRIVSKKDPPESGLIHHLCYPHF